MDNIEHMEKVFDNELQKMTKNQLVVLRFMLTRVGKVMTTRQIARKTGVVEKQLGGVLSAMSRKRVRGLGLIEPMGRDEEGGLRWMINSKAISVLIAEKRVRVLLMSFR